MGTHDLPDVYALSPQALGIHIRQITCAHVTTIKYVSKPRLIAGQHVTITTMSESQVLAHCSDV